MSASVVQPIVEVFSDSCTEDEIADIVNDVKQRFPSREIDDNLLTIFEELYQNGTIDKHNIDLLEILAEKSQKKAQIKSRLGSFKSSLPSKKDHVVGRSVEKQNFVRMLLKQENRGINLHGVSGVGKTRLAKEIITDLNAQNWTEYTFDLRRVGNIGQLYLTMLTKFGLTILFKSDEIQNESAIREMDKSRIIHTLEEKCTGQSKVLLLFDDVGDKVVAECQNELHSFVAAVNELEACKNGRLKIIMTSSIDISSDIIKGQNIKPLSTSSSKELICRRSKFDSQEEQFQLGKEEDGALAKIAEYCKNIPYNLEGVEQILRDRFISPVELLQKIEEQKKLGVNEEYLITLLVFNSIPQDNLKKLAVKVCVFPKHFYASDVMKVTELNSLYDAQLDLEVLAKQRVLTKIVDETSVKYDVHGLFKTFAESFLRLEFPAFEEEYKQAELMFGYHYLQRLRGLADNVVQDFTATFNEIRKDEFNFDVALQSPIFQERFLPFSNDETLCRMVMIIEPLKSISNRKELYKAWADGLEQKGYFLSSAYMRCWQATQLADMEGTATSEEILQQAELCFKKASTELFDTTSTISVRYAAVKALLLYCKGKLKCMKSAHPDKKKVKNDLLMRSREELLDALMIFQDVNSEHGLQKSDHIMAVRTLNVLGNCYMELSDPETAEGYYRQALEMKLRLTAGNEKHSEIPTFYNQLSQVHQMLGDKENKKFSFRGLVGLDNPKAKEHYEEAVIHLRKAIELNKVLGLEDTMGTATFNRNLANILIPMKRYNEALECAKASYDIRSKLLDKHPETVRILYLMGVINEWRKDPAAALLNYEEAFKMEEELPEDNHSVVKNLVCNRFERMCVRRNERKKLRSYGDRIKQLEKVKMPTESKPDEHESKQDLEANLMPLTDTYSTFSKEVTINVMEQGGTYDHSVDGFVLFFPANCVSGQVRIKCETNPSLPSPSNVNEHLVSSVIRLGPSDQILKKQLIVTMMHCGPGPEDGFETKMKVFNERKQAWEDKEEFQPATTPASEFSTQNVTISLTKLTAVAVVTRLISNTLEVPVRGCEVKLSVCPSITIRFPEGAVDTLIKGEIQVLPMPDHLVKNPECVPCAVLLFRGFKDVIFKKPVSISTTIPNLSQPTVRLLRLDDTRNSPFLWDDITSAVTKLGKPVVNDNTVELQVQQFCGLWIWFSGKNVIYSSYQLFTSLFLSPPCEVSFAAYRKKTNRQLQDNTTFELKLTCVANNKQPETTERLSDTQNYECLDELSANWKMRTNDKAYPDIPNIEKSKWTNDCFLEFYGHDQNACQKQFEVDTCDLDDPALVELYFRRYKDENTDRDCKMKLNLIETGSTEENQDPSKNVWVEYCGIDFDTLEDLPEDLCTAVNEMFSGNTRIQHQILDCRKRWYTGGLKEVLSLLSRLQFNQLHKVMSDLECFRSDATNQHLPKRLRLLQHGNQLVNCPLKEMPAEVKESINIIASIISIKNRMKFGRKLGIRKEDVKECHSSQEVLSNWLYHYESVARVADLFKAFKECGEKNLAAGLAKIITGLAEKALELEERSKRQ